ncbi:hypothetical protein M3J09_011820 [Ascochyta lentis]
MWRESRWSWFINHRHQGGTAHSRQLCMQLPFRTWCLPNVRPCCEHRHNLSVKRHMIRFCPELIFIKCATLRHLVSRFFHRHIASLDGLSMQSGYISIPSTPIIAITITTGIDSRIAWSKGSSSSATAFGRASIS